MNPGALSLRSRHGATAIKLRAVRHGAKVPEGQMRGFSMQKFPHLLNSSQKFSPPKGKVIF
ncbi:hypothetical protein BN59_02932 [Legionella massiliensis]|uniref:Uncharacterized protein n=1 Tax=Legionella massiliensis TaxID=1034943 RepID=A0A078L036_9GAMM|nr:hypothetical protein BN59_02932 [Legionella massiliensis]CEE14360.1 hypothetical protein BN1094_02932 [Legionella massiliensis]